MNITLITIALVVIATPGIGFRRGYFAPVFAQSFLPSRFGYDLIWSFVYSLILHGVAILIIKEHFAHPFTVDTIQFLVTGAFLSTTAEQSDKVLAVTSNLIGNLNWLFSYYVILSVASAGLGVLARNLVRYLKVDILFRFFRFPNDWRYTFEGEYLNIRAASNYSYKKLLRSRSARRTFRKDLQRHKGVFAVVTDILVEIGETKVLYTGLIEDYHMSKDKIGLDRITLKFPERKELILSPDPELALDNDGYRTIPGDFLSIPFDTIKNINFTYLGEINYTAGEEIKDIAKIDLRLNEIFESLGVKVGFDQKTDIENKSSVLNLSVIITKILSHTGGFVGPSKTMFKEINITLEEIQDFIEPFVWLHINSSENINYAEDVRIMYNMISCINEFEIADKLDHWHYQDRNGKNLIPELNSSARSFLEYIKTELA